MKKNTAIIFGGAFNPPTKAHVEILQEAVNYASELEAEVWLLPSGNRKDKTIPTPNSLRIAYTEAMIRDIILPEGVKVKIELSELLRETVVQTFDTVQELNLLYPEYDFIWVFGADSTTTMPEWNEGEWLMEHLTMMVINRTGSEINRSIKNYKEFHITTPDISSTMLRERILSEENYDELVTPNVNIEILRMLVIQ